MVMWSETHQLKTIAKMTAAIVITEICTTPEPLHLKRESVKQASHQHDVNIQLTGQCHSSKP